VEVKPKRKRMGEMKASGKGDRGMFQYLFTENRGLNKTSANASGGKVPKGSVSVDLAGGEKHAHAAPEGLQDQEQTVNSNTTAPHEKGARPKDRKVKKKKKEDSEIDPRCQAQGVSTNKEGETPDYRGARSEVSGEEHGLREKRDQAS